MEIELKFQLPESKKKTVLQTLNKQKAQKIQLQAKYYDTADRLLAKNYVAIRLRQEGEHWVQTFKAASKNHLQRIEEDIYLGKCEQEPELDLSLYQHNRTVQTVLSEI
jgi:adenylate cyclase class IV